MERILVTGATGFVGSHLVEGLLKEGHEVYCLVRNVHTLRWLHGLPLNLIIGDCREKDLGLPKVDVIYHLAGIVKAKRPSLFYQVNYLGTVNLIKSVLRQKIPIKAFVFISTLAVNGQKTQIITPNDPPCPQTHYAKSKWLAEQTLTKFKETIPVIIFRPTAIYGPRDKEFLSYFQVIKQGFAPILNPDGILSFCYVADVVQALMKVLRNDIPSGKVFLLSDGKAYTWQFVINTISDILNKKPFVIKVPKFLTYFAAMGVEFYSHFLKNPLIFSRNKLKEVFQKSWFCDISETQALLGYKPQYTLAEGMALTLRWYQIHGWL